MKKEFVFIFVLIFLSFVSAADNFNISSSAGNNLFFVNGTSGDVNILKNLNVTGTIYGTLALSSAIPTNNNQLTNGNNYWNSTFATFNKTYADTLYYGIGNPSGFIDWSKAVNGTLALSSSLNNYLLKTDWNSTNTSYYLATNPFGFYNETTLPVTSSVWNRSSTNVFLANTGDNVGIGTTTPNTPLHLYNTLDNILKLQNPDGGWNYISFYNSTNQVGYFGMRTDSRMTWNDQIVLNTETGNVGIGTNSPNYKLTTLAETGANRDIALFGVNGYSNGFTIKYEDSPQKMIYSFRDGNVGIGTNSPAYPLSVKSQSGSALSSMYMTNDFVQGTSGSALLMTFGATSGNAVSKLQAVTTGNTVYGNLILNGAGGNVGIGTTSPTQKLSVEVTSGLPATSGTTQNGIARFYEPSHGITLDIGANSNSPYQTWIQATNTINLANTYSLLLNPNGGNVGIGTTSPVAKLSLVGTKSDTIGDTPYLGYDTDGVGSLFGFRLGADNNLYLDRRYSSTPYNVMSFIRSSGNVGIGTTTPTTKLTVSGDLLLSGASGYRKLWLNANGDLGGSGRIGSIQKDYTTSPYNMNIYASYGLSGSSSPITFYRDSVNPTMIIDSSGNVGIGTTSPDYLLELTSITPAISFENTASSNKKWRITSSVNDLSVVETGVLTRMTFQAGGNVGIGTTTPDNKLTIVGEVDKIVSSVGTTASPSVEEAMVSKSTDFSHEAGMYDINSFTTNHAHWLKFTVVGTASDTPNDAMTIYHNGNVGIGTTSPSSLLQVGLGLFLKSDYTLDWGGSTPFGSLNWDTGKAIVKAKSGKDLSFGSNNSVDELYIKSGGNVGIGTTTPLSKLSVGGVGDTNYAIYGTGGVRGVYGSGTDAGVFGKDSASGSYGLLGYHTYGVYGDGTTYGVYGSGDNTGVRGSGTTGVRGEGTTGVRGSGTNAGVSGFSSANTGVVGSGGTYDFYANGSGTDYGTSSSMRWKENITEIQNALDKVLNLRGVYFTWNGYNNNTNDDMGFIAEEVGDIVPEIVGFENSSNESNYYYNEKGEKKLYASGVDYGALTPMLVQAIKELKEEKDNNYEELKLENEELRKENNLMKEELCKKDNSYSWCKTK